MNNYGNANVPLPSDPMAALWEPAELPVRQLVAPGVAAVVAAKGDLWRTEELLAEGYSKRQLGALIRDGGLTRLRRGVLVRTSLWRTLSQDEQGRMRLAAYAHRTLPTSADGLTFSHTSGGRLHRLALWEVDERIHVTVPYRPSGESHAPDVIPHTSLLLPAERTVIDGLPVTSLERTAADCARILNYRQALILLDNALRRGADRARMESMCQELKGARGVAAFRAALAHADARSESPGETLTRDAIRRLGLPAPVPQFVVRTAAGERRLDLAWPEARVALEFDGRQKYFDFQPTDQAIFQELRREKLLMEQGWVFVRIEWADLFRERQLKSRLLAAGVARNRGVGTAKA